MSKVVHELVHEARKALILPGCQQVQILLPRLSEKPRNSKQDRVFARVSGFLYYKIIAYHAMIYAVKMVQVVHEVVHEITAIKKGAPKDSQLYFI